MLLEVMLPEIHGRVARNSWSCRQKFPYTLDKISGGMTPVSGDLTGYPFNGFLASIISVRQRVGLWSTLVMWLELCVFAGCFITSFHSCKKTNENSIY